MEILRNPNGNFELLFPLVTAADTSGDWLTGKASELDVNTILIYYHNATVWIAATFSGTVLELGTTGKYNIKILASWFTARDENYPISIKIIDDSGTKAWKDTGGIIQGNMHLEQLEVSRSDAEPAVKFNNGSTGNALDVNSASGYGIRVTSDNAALSLESVDSAGLNISSTNINAVVLTAPGGVGLLVTSYAECIELNSTNSLTGIKAQRINLIGASGLPSLQIHGLGAAPTISITSNADKGIYVSSVLAAVDIISSAGAGIVINSSTEGLSISGATGLKIVGSSFQGVSITGGGASDALQIFNSSTGAAVGLISSSSLQTLLVDNTGTGIGLSVKSIDDAAFKMRSTNQKDIDAAEITDIQAKVIDVHTELPSVGPISSQGDVQALSNNTRYRVDVPTFAQIPVSGDIMVPISFYFLDDAGLPYDPDSSELAIQVRAVNQQAYKVVNYDDEAGTTPATINATFSPSYYTVIKLGVGEYMTYFKVASTETQDTWQIKFKFKESTNEITIPAQMYVTEEVVSITLDDSLANRQIIAKSMKTEEIVESEVSGSIYKDIKDEVDDIVSKLPLTGLISNFGLASVADGKSVEFILELILAMFTGKYIKDTPSSGQLTIFKQDNVTPLAIVSITQSIRERILPA